MREACERTVEPMHYCGQLELVGTTFNRPSSTGGICEPSPNYPTNPEQQRVSAVVTGARAVWSPTTQAGTEREAFELAILSTRIVAGLLTSEPLSASTEVRRKEPIREQVLGSRSADQY